MAPRCPVKIAGVVAGVPLTFADQLLIQTWLQAAKQEHVWKRACGAAQNDAESSKRSKKSISHDDGGGMEEDAEYEKGDFEVASEDAWERLRHLEGGRPGPLREAPLPYGTLLATRAF